MLYKEGWKNRASEGKVTWEGIKKKNPEKAKQHGN